jgi:hypothetical protein
MRPYDERLVAIIAIFCDDRIMDVTGDIAAIRNPLPRPEDVTPRELYLDAREQVEQARIDDALSLEAASDGLETDPLLLALRSARDRRAAADDEIRRLLAYGRTFHGTRPYKLEDLAGAVAMTPSGVRTAFDEPEIAFVAREVGREPDGRRTRQPDPDLER